MGTPLLTEQEQSEPASLTIRHYQRHLELSDHHSGVTEGKTQRRARGWKCLRLNQGEADLGELCFSGLLLKPM